MGTNKSKFFMTDGLKSTGWLESDDPAIWQFFSGAPSKSQQRLYGFVAAVFRAYNLKANTVGNMPFALFKGKEEFDSSATWENKVGFLPNPSELFRLDTLSYMDSNSIYNVMTSDALGWKPRGLHNVIPSSCVPCVSPATGQVEYIERTVAPTIRERYDPKGKPIEGAPSSNRLVYMWRLDHTSELLPSLNTEAQAIQHAAEQVLYTDVWIKNYFKAGGIRPLLVAMKGLVDKDSKEDKEKSWWNWLRGLGQYTFKKAKIFNAETLTVEQFGDGIGDLKENETYNQALSNIATGTGMPLSLLLANSANYATAKEEKATWYENDIIPLCNWIAYEYNRQVFEPMKMRLEFKPETLDPQQEDETQRAQAFSTYMDAMTKCPTYELFEGWCETMGLEVSEKLLAAAKKFYSDKEQKEKELQTQMQQNGVVVGPDGKPIPVKPGEEKPTDKEEDDEEKKPAKWLPSIDELEEMRIYREVALRNFKKGKSLDFEYQSKAVSLPENVTTSIRSALASAANEEQIKAAFEVRPEAKESNDIRILADALNNLAKVKHVVNDN